MPLLKKVKFSDKLKKEMAENSLKYYARASAGLLNNTLEVKDKSGEWIPVSSSYDEIVCNIGDMMQLITDHKLKSTPHRVVKYKTDEIKSRYSIPFFLHPAPSILLKSVFREDDKGVLANDFLDKRLKEIKLY